MGAAVLDLSRADPNPASQDVLAALRADTEESIAAVAAVESATMSDTKLGPGMYRDDRNCLRLNVPELLAHLGYADTPENREALAEAVMIVWKQKYPDKPARIVSLDHLP